MLLREFAKAWHFVRSVPKTLLFNFRYLTLADAIRLPVLVSHRIRITRLRGKVTVTSTRFGSVKLGFEGSDAFPVDGTSGVWHLGENGHVKLGTNILLGPGARVHCTGLLELGNDLRANAAASFFCAKHIQVGRGALLAWNVTLMDHDFHGIWKDGAQINSPADIKIAEAVWLGADVLVLKGSKIARGVVVGARAVVHGEYAESGCVIAGNPAKVVRTGVTWQMPLDDRCEQRLADPQGRG